MKQIKILLGLILLASVSTFAQSPRIKLNQITKDTVKGSVLISSPSDSGMVYSRDLFVSYGADTVLILGGDTLAATSSIISSVLSDGVTITGDGTTGSVLTVDTATVIATKQDLDLYYLDSNPDGYTSNTGTVTSVGGTGTVNGISLSGSVTSSGNLTLGGTLSGVDLASQVTGTLPIANGGTGSATQNFVDLSSAQTVGGAKTFSDVLYLSGGDTNQSGDKPHLFRISGGGLGLSANYESSGNQNIQFYTSGLERMRISSGGNIGINTTSPSVGLDIADGQVAGTIKIGADINAKTRTDNTWKLARVVAPHYDNDEENLYLFGGSSDGTDNLLIFGGSASSNNAATQILFYTAATTTTVDGTQRMRITSDGEVWIANSSDQGAYNLQVGGTGVWGAGAYVNGSDRLLKENIQSLNKGLDYIKKLNPVEYNYKSTFSSDQSKQLGFIAQDVMVALEDISDAIVKDNGNYLSMAYQNLIPITVKAIQEQQTIIESQSTEIEQLKTLITDLSNRLQILENN